MNRTAASTREYIARIHSVLEHVNAHLADDLSLAALARVSCFSPFHFHRVFSAMVGESPVEFVKRVRLQRAASMLQHNPTTPVTEVGLSCGFSSSAVFSRAFRTQFGTSPTAWRVQTGKKNSKEGKAVGKNRKAISRDSAYLLHNSPLLTSHVRRRTQMEVTIQHRPRLHVAYVANLGGYRTDLIKSAWDRVCGWAGPLGLLEPPAEALGISFDDPKVTPANRCRYYACLTIQDNVTPPRDIGVLDIPAGQYAVLAFDGVREEIPRAYDDLYARWLPGSGYQPDDHPCYEVYRISPEDDPEGRFVMDIYMPVKPM
jgi:AraC family transcriptional regulator